MKLMRAMRLSLSALLLAGAIAGGVQAQGPGGGQGPPPAIMEKIKKWQKWQDKNKPLSSLGLMMMQIREVEKDPATSLNKAQAKKLMGILKTWRNKPEMSNNQAKSVAKQISGVMTDKQLKKMATVQNPFGRRGGGGGGFGGGGGRPGGGGGGPRPGGGGGPGGGGFNFPDPPSKGYNPLNPDTLPFERMRPQAKKSMDEFMAALAKKA